MKHLVKIVLFYQLTTLFCQQAVFGQAVPVGTPLLEDAYRRGQLLGSVDVSASFASRPFFPYLSDGKGYLLTDPLITNELNTPLKFGSTLMNNNNLMFKVLPFTWQQQYNSDHPEGLNDGAMIPARGYQTMISGGLFFRFKWLSIQLKPELVMAGNKDYQGFMDGQPDSVWRIYNSKIISSIDLPEQFGNGTYQKVFWGQSSIRLTLGPVSLGLSNENLWWGPGMQNALLMTNTAPGFKHLTLNTVRPIKTFIGSFEGQMVSGRLDASGYPPIDTLRLHQHNIKYKSKPDDWRYLNGIVLSYQPKWIPGLFLGATRSFIVYHAYLGNGLNDYLPVITPMLKKSAGQTIEDAIPRDQLASLFVRWVAPEAHQEVYFEYGHEDHNYDLTDLVLEPEHSAAYILGARKLVPIGKLHHDFLDFQIELTHLEAPLSAAVRSQGSWYLHSQIKDGYTHNGQYLGAGIGSGSNMESVNVSWISELKRIGISFKRVAHNEDFWAKAIKDYRKHWVDIGVTLFGEWNYKNILFTASVETVGSINYQFYYDPVPSDPPLWWDHGKIRYNVHAELGVNYCF